MTTKTTATMRAAYKDGIAARINQIDRSANPHGPSSCTEFKKHDAWDYGWFKTDDILRRARYEQQSQAEGK